MIPVEWLENIATCCGCQRLSMPSSRLPCYHVMCSSCFTKLCVNEEQDDIRSCPACRTKFCTTLIEDENNYIMNLVSAITYGIQGSKPEPSQNCEVCEGLSCSEQNISEVPAIQANKWTNEPTFEEREEMKEGPWILDIHPMNGMSYEESENSSEDSGVQGIDLKNYLPSDEFEDIHTTSANHGIDHETSPSSARSGNSNELPEESENITEFSAIRGNYLSKDLFNELWYEESKTILGVSVNGESDRGIQPLYGDPGKMNESPGIPGSDPRNELSPEEHNIISEVQANYGMDLKRELSSKSLTNLPVFSESDEFEPRIDHENSSSIAEIPGAAPETGTSSLESLSTSDDDLSGSDTTEVYDICPYIDESTTPDGMEMEKFVANVGEEGEHVLGTVQVLERETQSSFLFESKTSLSNEWQTTSNSTGFNTKVPKSFEFQMTPSCRPHSPEIQTPPPNPIGVINHHPRTMTSPNDLSTHLIQCDNISSLCVQCAQEMCRTCTAKHALMSSSKAHYVFTFGQSVDIRGWMLACDSKQDMCPFHPSNKCVMFCENCHSVGCLRCLINHEGHVCRNINIYAQEQKLKLILDEILFKEITDAQISEFKMTERGFFQEQDTMCNADIKNSHSDQVVWYEEKTSTLSRNCLAVIEHGKPIEILTMYENLKDELTELLSVNVIIGLYRKDPGLRSRVEAFIERTGEFRLHLLVCTNCSAVQ